MNSTPRQSTTWHRIDPTGLSVRFTVTPDERGTVHLTTQEVEGLFRSGGWRVSCTAPDETTT